MKTNYGEVKEFVYKSGITFYIPGTTLLCFTNKPTEEKKHFICLGGDGEISGDLAGRWCLTGAMVLDVARAYKLRDWTTPNGFIQSLIDKCMRMIILNCSDNSFFRYEDNGESGILYVRNGCVYAPKQILLNKKPGKIVYESPQIITFMRDKLRKISFYRVWRNSK